jgi:hypothetical protein
MPKQIYEINSFSTGIVNNPKDELDIPHDAATKSLNIDPLTGGELKGIPTVQILKTNGFTNEFSTVAYVKPSVGFSAVNEQSTAAMDNAPITD